MFKNLYASGCSLTYGYGLKDPLTERWSARLAKILNVTETNDATSGNSNWTTTRKMMEWIEKHPTKSKDTLFIYQITYASRFEWPRMGENGEGNIIAFPEIYEFIDLCSIEGTVCIPNEHWQVERFINYHSLLQQYTMLNFLEDNDLNYMFVQGDKYDGLYGTKKQRVKQQPMQRILNSKENYLTDFNCYFLGRRELVQGHPNAKSQNAFAEHLEGVINEVF